MRDRPVRAVSENLNAPLGALADDSFRWSDTSSLLQVSSAGLAVGPALRPSPDVLIHQYDALGRLTGTARNGVPLASYAYRDNGSLSAATEVTSSTYAYVADRLMTQSWPGHAYTFTYDENGSALTQTRLAGDVPQFRRDYVWDDLGRLDSSIENDESLVQYEYLGGERIRTRFDSPTETRDQLEIGPWARLDIVTGRFTNRVMLGSRVLFEDREGEGVSMPHRSMGSSVVAVTSAAGDILRQEEFYPYGRTQAAQGSATFDQHFHGIRDDQLIVAGGRAYDPDVGRWIARDRVLFSPAAAVDDPRFLDGYGYSYSAPTNYRDPSGCCATLGTGDWCQDRTEKQKNPPSGYFDDDPFILKLPVYITGGLAAGSILTAVPYVLPSATTSGTAAAAGTGTGVTAGGTTTATTAAVGLTTAQSGAVLGVTAARTGFSIYGVVQTTIAVGQKATVASSKVLGGALTAAGHTRPLFTAAHHIVAGNDARAAAARGVLQQFGIGINDAANGVFLPAHSGAPNPSGAAIHSTLHTNAYYGAVNQALLTATNRNEALTVLADLQQSLLSGGI